MLMKNIIDCVPSYEEAIDFRPQVTHECYCGSQMFRIICMFEDYEISQYFLDMECINCGSRYFAPTPVDAENDI